MELQDKINEIFINTISMFDLTIKYLNNSFGYFFDEDISVDKINDDLIDTFLIKIEKECLNIILRERPFARDLRKVTGIFKVVDDIERIGDHCEDIKWCVDKLKNYIVNRAEIKLLIEMINVSLKMVKDAYNSLIKEDIELAKEVLKTDDVVDNLYLNVLKGLESIKSNNKNNNVVIYSTLITKYIERIADHASNIAEWAIYIKSGYYKAEVII